MRPIVFELCAETIEACIAARDGGADRIELCANLNAGGLTPSRDLIAEAVRVSRLPVHVMIRPRAGGFCYTEAEATTMTEEIHHATQLGAAGIVLGALSPDFTVDRDLTQRLVAAAASMQVTFHRAFDETPSLPDALEAIIATGCDRILTSGGRHDVLAGADMLSALIRQADGRADIAVGGGLRLENAAAVARRTNAVHFHGSLRQSNTSVDVLSVQKMIAELKMS